MLKFKITSEHGFEMIQAVSIFAAMRTYERSMRANFRPMPVKVELVTE